MPPSKSNTQTVRKVFACSQGLQQVQVFTNSNLHGPRPRQFTSSQESAETFLITPDGFRTSLNSESEPSNRSLSMASSTRSSTSLAVLPMPDKSVSFDNSDSQLLLLGSSRSESFMAMPMPNLMQQQQQRPTHNKNLDFPQCPMGTMRYQKCTTGKMRWRLCLRIPLRVVRVLRENLLARGPSKVVHGPHPCRNCCWYKNPATWLSSFNVTPFSAPIVGVELV
jgi:hypothetical protein